MSKIVRYKLEELTELTDKQMAEIEALAKRPDNEIDFSDIPELDESFGKMQSVIPTTNQSKNRPLFGLMLMSCSGLNPRAKAIRPE